MDIVKSVREYIEEIQGDITWDGSRRIDFYVEDTEYSVLIDVETSTINLQVITIGDVVDVGEFQVNISYESVISDYSDIVDVFENIIGCQQIENIKKAINWADDAYEEFDADTINFLRVFL